MRDFVFGYIKKKYNVSPDYPWMKYDDNAVFRHSDNRKWFALVMGVRKDKLGLSGEVRAVSRIEQRVREGERLGFKKIAVPARNLGKTDLKVADGTTLVPIKTVFDLLPLLKKGSGEKA